MNQFTFFFRWLTEFHFFFFFFWNYNSFPPLPQFEKRAILLEFYYKTKRCRPLPTICIIKLELKRVRHGTDPVKSSRLLALGLGCHQTEFGFPLICKKKEGKAKQAARRKLTPSHLPCKVKLNSEVNGEKVFDKAPL